MGVIKTSLESLRSFMETDFGFPCFTGIQDSQIYDRDALIQLDDNNPWEVSQKDRSFYVLITFRFKLDNIQPTIGDAYYEDDAQDEVYNYIDRLISGMIVGLALVHARTQFSKDEKDRYLGMVLFRTYLNGGITPCLN